MLVLLIGPKGSGKSHVGRVVAESLGVHFIPVEQYWLAYNQQCAAEGRAPVISEGQSQVRPTIKAALRHYSHVCVETTGASTEILDDLLAMASPQSTTVVRVHASLATCLQRIRSRDGTQQIFMSEEQIRIVHDVSQRCTIEPDVMLNNESLTDDEIVAAIGPFLR